MISKPVRALEAFQAARTRVLPLVKGWLSSHELGTILLLGLVEGLLCFIVIPAWWHYDEPGHFEYAWLAAHSPTWPVPGQYDQSMRKEMAVSMLSDGWYQIRNFKVDLSSNEPIPIGVTQVGDQPGYYFLISLPLRLIPHAGITVQYYVARAVSLLLYLLIIAVVWYALGEILPRDHPLRWMATVFVALSPAFADTMVSVNNDVSAVLAASLFLWAGLRLIQRGYSVSSILFLFVSLIACYLSKNTAWFAFLLTPFVLILALLRARWAPVMWAVVAVILVGTAILALTWGSPQAWYQGAVGDYPLRVQTKNAPLGKYAFQLDASGANGAGQILQIMTPDDVKLLRGKTATLGAWVWADRPTPAGPFFIRFLRHSGDIEDSPQLLTAVTAVPAFYKLSFSVPSDATNAVMYIQQAPHDQPSNNLFFDGLVLVPGEFDANPPHFAGADGAQGIWDGRKFQNLLRNPSAEAGSIQVRKWVDDKAGSFLVKSGVNLSWIIATAQDWRGTGWYYRGSAATLFRTFWASLAGDKAFLASSYVSYFLLVLTIGGLLGAAVRLWRRRKDLHWDVIGFLAISLVPWLLAVARGSSDLLQGDAFSPWARYAFPAILPTAFVLCAGWLEWLEILPGGINLTTDTRKAIFFSIMAGISVFTIVNAIQVFHPAWWYGWVSLALLFLFQYVIFHFSTRRGAQVGT